MSDVCRHKKCKWKKWEFAGYKDTGGAVEFRQCKRCGKRQHREVEYVTNRISTVQTISKPCEKNF